MQEVQEELLTVQDVAALLRVPVSWVYEHVRPDCGHPLPHLKVGKYLRFLQTDILNYLQAIREKALHRH